MDTHLFPKPINFQFGNYISEAIDLLKKHFLEIFIVCFFALLLSIIPFCALLALGNLLKFFDKLDRGENPNPTEMFNFEDFTPYLILQLVYSAILIGVFIPLLFFILFLDDAHKVYTDNPVLLGLFIVYLFCLMLVIFYIVISAFYIPGLVSLKKITDIKTLWNTSKSMVKGNYFNLIAFLFIVTILSNLGIILFFIGIFITLPLRYVAGYYATKDALRQIETSNKLY